MSEVYKSNIKKIVDENNITKRKVINSFRAGMYLGMQAFLGHVQKTQMSGRPGLKTITGQLKRSWYVDRVDLNTIKMGNAEKYAAIHQFGGTINHPGGTPYIIKKEGKGLWLKKDGNYPHGVKFTKPHTIAIPKRLYVYEEFDTIGKELIFRAITSKLEARTTGGKK